jgi:hypothetical protein
MSGGLDEIYAVTGVAATFTDRSDVDTAVTAIVSHELEPYGPDVGSTTAGTVAVSVRKSDLARSPIKGESYTVGAKTYYVDSVLAEDDLEHTVLAS